MEIALGDPDNFSTLTGFLQAANLVDTLSGEGPFTVFAPTNEAFAAVPADIVAALTADTALLTQVLTYHVAPEEIFAEDLDPMEEIETVEGSPLPVTVDPTVTIGGAGVVMADIEASNGVIHVIDTVLVPPTLVLPTTAVSPPTTSVAAPVATTAAPPSPGNTIVDLAAATDDLSTLAFLLRQGGFLEALSGPGPFTVFAPTNAAFANLPGSGWIASNPSLLQPTLLYHVIGDATILSTQLAVDATAETLEGRSIKVTSMSPSVVINDRATVITADIQASNGVIHIVDTVLIPKNVV